MSEKNIEAANSRHPLLSTAGELAITFLGTGSAFSKRFYQTNLIVAKGEESLLVDCGSRTPEALDRLGIPITQIQRCLITHTHADHIGGLEELMLINRYVAGRRVKMVISDLLKGILWNQSLRGGAAWNEVHEGSPLGFEDFWIQERPRRQRGGERELASLRLGELEIHLFRTMHIPDSAAGWEDSFPSYGMVFDRHILFSSDTRFDPGLIGWAESTFPIDSIFHDVQLYRGGVHASLEELASLPAQTKAKMTLMHYGDKMPESAGRVLELGFAGIAEQGRTYRF